MTDPTTRISSPETDWLKHYYSLRFAVAALWAAAAFAVGREPAAAAAMLLIAYPAWDAFANYLDARRSGGLAANAMQATNAAISLATAAAVALALGQDMAAVLAVFGIWAIVAGLLQLGAAVRRWRRSGAQWVMVPSGAQSALAGGFFLARAYRDGASAVEMIAGYAAIGALYFLISALWLFGSAWWRGRTPA